MKPLLVRFLVIAPALLTAVMPTAGLADVLAQMPNLPNAPISYGGSTIDNVFVPVPGGQVLMPEQTPGQNLGAFNIFIAAGPTLSANAPAMAAFQRAANAWKAFISDPILVTINADLGGLGAGILGSTSTVVLQAPYNTIRNAVVADAAAEADDPIMASTPTAAQFSAFIPSGTVLTGNMLATKANLKALGFGGLDGSFGVNDATITFSTNFIFDFDNSNGVTPGTTDFETVAAHEIGHALGFISIVDSIVAGAKTNSPFTLDLLRFRNDVAGQDPSTAGEFTTFPRSLLGGVDAITDGVKDPEWRMSTGVTGGDGRQASHWKADELTGTLIGLMDPTLATGVFYGPMAPDLRALDLIGYDIVPEPSSLSLLLLGGAVAASIRRRKA